MKTFKEFINKNYGFKDEFAINPCDFSEDVKHQLDLMLERFEKIYNKVEIFRLKTTCPNHRIIISNFNSMSQVDQDKIKDFLKINK